jgi:hypothetical protein
MQQQTPLTQWYFIGICPKESLFDRLQFVVGQIVLTPLLITNNCVLKQP